jgi:UDP:flavonoid glycosyltransferase YjiC (YdhE family)
MVCHGGFNTVMGAMCEGVPIVCTPIAGDQIYNARRCEELGLGIQISRAQVTPGGIRIAVRKLLDEPSFGMQVGKVRDEIAGLPDVATLVPRIEALARVSS